MDMAAYEADDLAIIEHRLPDMNIRCVGGHIAAIWIVGDANIAWLIIVDHFQDWTVVDAVDPRCSEGM